MRSRLFRILSLALLPLGCGQGGDLSSETAPVREFIASAWDSSVRCCPQDRPDSLIGMPLPYTVPCVEGMFDEMYYWDTYFTNEGLLADGREDLAANNVEDVLYMIDRYGFMPNGNRLWYLSRSQPPFAALMVERLFDATGDTLLPALAYPVLENEYDFWMRERSTPEGLNRYGWNDPDEKLVQEFITTAGRRLGEDFRAKGWSGEELERFGLNCIAECESGWDFNPRFDRRCSDFCPVDLNALLYATEKAMARFAALTGRDSSIWNERAQARRETMARLFRDPDSGCWYDYDWAGGKRSTVVSAAVFALLYTGAVDESDAASIREGMLPLLEQPCGLAVTSLAHERYPYQWAFPNAWPPTTLMAVEGLRNYGYEEDARRLAEKYLRTTAKLWRESGNLWEKTTATDASMPVDKEYDTPQMLGWTAGVFVKLDEYLNNQL